MDSEIFFRGGDAYLKFKKQDFLLPKSLGITKDNHEGSFADDVDFEMHGKGIKIISFSIEGKKFNVGNTGDSPASNQTRQKDDKIVCQADNARRSARAPYNFVALNTQVIDGQSLLPNERYYSDRHTGYIEIELENLTHLFIRANRENFLFINSKPIVAGSSLRGMLKSIVEIISKSKFVNYENKVLSHRLLADTVLSDIYKSKISTNEKVGYFVFDERERKYYIKPALFAGKPAGQGSKKHHIDYLPGEKNYLIFSGKMPGKSHDWKIGPPLSVARLPISGSALTAYKKDVNRTSEIDYIKFVDDKATFPIGVPVFYNDDGKEVVSFGHTRNYRLPYRYAIGEFVIKKDEHNKEDLDFSESIFGKLENHASRIFVEDARRKVESVDATFSLKVMKPLSSPNPTSFQLYMRQPFDEKTPKPCLYHWETNAVTDKKNNVDPQIRGYKRYWHRNINREHIPEAVSWFNDEFSFEKRHFVNFLKNIKYFNNGAVKQLLANVKTEGEGVSGKLVFSSDLGSFENKKLLELLIDFFFLDHKVAKKHKIPKPLYPLVNAINPGSEFKGRIRFENLTDEELGLLLLALDLPKNCCHKLGMGKPLGLGTVRLKCELHLSDREKRYSGLVADSKWHLPEKNEKSIDHFKKIFLKQYYSWDHPGEANSAWDSIDVLKQLKQMLLWDEVKMKDDKWLKETSYMPLQNTEAYRDRWVLPKPETIKSKF